MSNFFTDVLGDLDGLEEKLLGPDYSYYQQIKSPEQIGMSGDGNISALTNDIAGLIAYTQLLVTGGGNASKVDGPLGDRFFLQTGAKCKDTASGNQVNRSIYINNIPDGTIPFISSGMGTQFSTFEGIIPGTLGNLANINPLEIFQAFLSGTNPDCTATKLRTVDADNNVSMGTGYLTTPDIQGMNPCWFPDHTNPITKATKAGCNEGFQNLDNKYASYSSSSSSSSSTSPSSATTQRSTNSNIGNVSNIIAYVYFVSLILLVTYIMTRSKKH
jgi:hypothetical protein